MQGKARESDVPSGQPKVQLSLFYITLRAPPTPAPCSKGHQPGATMLGLQHTNSELLPTRFIQLPAAGILQHVTRPVPQDVDMQLLQAPARAKSRLPTVGERFAHHSQGNGTRILAGDPHTEPGVQHASHTWGPPHHPRHTAIPLMFPDKWGPPDGPQGNSDSSKQDRKAEIRGREEEERNRKEGIRGREKEGIGGNKRERIGANKHE